jgi:hypothetical protein
MKHFVFDPPHFLTYSLNSEFDIGSTDFQNTCPNPNDLAQIKIGLKSNPVHIK